MIEYAIRNAKSGWVIGRVGGGTYATREQAQEAADHLMQVSASPREPWEVVEWHISDWVQAGAR